MESLHNASALASLASLPTTLRVSTIERELARLWSDAERAGEGHPPLRPRTANLIVATPDASALLRAGEIATRIAARHPGRAIVVGPDPTAERLQAAVAVHCPLTPGGRARLCSEVVTLAGPPAGLDEAHSAVAGLLVPDLPTFLWWQRPVPTAGRLFTTLARLADCLVVDSRTFSDAAGGLDWLVRVFELSRGELEIADLEWGRLTAWRELIARAFRAADTRTALDSLLHVTVRYAPGREQSRLIPPPAVGLLVGWLASRLQWQPVSSYAPTATSGWSRNFQHVRGVVEVQVLPAADPDLVSDELSAVELDSFEGPEQVRVSIARDPNSTFATTTVAIGQQVVRQQVAPLAVPPVHELVAVALDTATTDPVFRDTLFEAAGRSND